MLCLLMLTALAGPEINLLQNPAFEQISAGMPDHWNLFVMEHPAVPPNTDPPYGTTDTGARDGAQTLLLHNTIAYRNEPCNNWSQIIWENLAGKTVRVKGSIKTENATAAEIWLQCWQRTPYRLLHVETTSDRTRISGDTDWKDVEMTVKAPPLTDFLIIRCVLRGTGKAWFGPLSVSEVTAEPLAAAPAAEHHEKKDTEPDVKHLDEMLQSLRLTSKANHDLMVNVQNLQHEILALREQLRTLQQAAAAHHEPPQTDQPGAEHEPEHEPEHEHEHEHEHEPETPRKIPPLVPHGMKPEDFQ